MKENSLYKLKKPEWWNLVDTQDLKSCGFYKTVPVQVWPRAPSVKLFEIPLTKRESENLC